MKGIKILTTFIFSVIFISVVVVSATWVSDKKIEITKNYYENQVKELNETNNQYKKQYNDILTIREKYKESIKEIVELLYNKNVPHNIGGSSNLTVSTSDEVLLLEIRNTIETMKDDQKMLSEVKNYLTARKAFIESFPFIWPVLSTGIPQITSGYGFREDLFRDGKVHFHEGIDIKGAIGDAVRSTAAGKVITAQTNHPIMGKVIVIQHNYGLTTSYGHMSKLLVKAGQNVVRGQKIALVGNEGKSLGPHLHYEIRKDKNSIDPMDFLSLNM